MVERNDYTIINLENLIIDDSIIWNEYSNLLTSKSNESIGLGCEYCQFWLQKYFPYTYLLLSLLLSSVLRNTIAQLKFWQQRTRLTG